MQRRGISAYDGNDIFSIVWLILYKARRFTFYLRQASSRSNMVAPLMKCARNGNKRWRLLELTADYYAGDMSPIGDNFILSNVRKWRIENVIATATVY